MWQKIFSQWHKIPKNVKILGLVSFFNDFASEMIYPIVPIFLTSVLHTSIPLVGVIEGLVEATASIGKYLFGSLSDYFQKRKVFVVMGYSFGAASKLLIALATGWQLVLFARFIDRTGKGLRTAPRDSLLLENATATNRGYIFGFHRAFDSLGAVVGPIVALILLFLLKDNLRLTFLFAFIPSIIGVLLLFFFIKESNPVEKKQQMKFVKISWHSIDYRLKIFLIVSVVFAIGNSSDAFLILRSNNLGLSTSLTVLAYILYNITQTIFATPAGKLSDMLGPKKIFSIGLLVFAFVYFFFGLIQNTFWIWFLFPIYGLYIAATDGVSKAFVAQFIRQQESASYFGFYYTLTALGNFIASFVGGLLWTYVHPSTTFFYGSMMAIMALLIFQLTNYKTDSNKV